MNDLGVPKNTLSTLIKNKDKIINNFESAKFEPQRKRARTAQFEDVEEAIHKWFVNTRAQNMPVRGPIIRTQAEKLAKQLGYPDFKCSSGWLQRFQARHDIGFRRICGEATSVNTDNVHDWYQKVFQDILQTYESKDIYNCDETGIFFKMLPDKSLTFKTESAHGTKSSKERLTVLVASNMTGSDKNPLLVIGKSQKPRCFKNQKSLPTDYSANKSSWMTSEIFTTWIKQLDARFDSEGRTVAMLLDNCAAHPKVPKLAVITLYFLPPNTTSVTQPMDQGIIQNLKCHYRRQLVERMSECIEENQSFSVTVLDALHLLKGAWDRITPETISNSHRQCTDFS